MTLDELKKLGACSEAVDYVKGRTNSLGEVQKNHRSVPKLPEGQRSSLCRIQEGLNTSQSGI